MKKRDCARCATPTRAALRVKQQIARYLENPGVKSPRLADALKAQENKPMATRAQIAAARRNIKKAQAARKHKRRGGRRRAASANANPRHRAKRRYMKRRKHADNRGRYEENRRKRSRHKRRKRASAAAMNENPTTVVLENAWKGQPRLHAKAARLGHRRRKAKRRKPARRRSASRRRTKRCPPCRYRRTRKGQFAGGLSRRKLAMLENPGTSGGMLANAGNPLTASGLMSYGIAAAGLGLGLVVADFTDRLVATRKPSKNGKNPWYGRDAAAAINRRPDAMRLGVQVLGGVAGLALAYWTRGRSILPWLASGIALGFGGNAVLKIVNWYLIPAVLKVDPNKPMSLGNRTHSLEQDAVQKEIDKVFQDPVANPALSPGQQGEASVVVSPLGDLTTNLMVLGEGRDQGKAKPHSDSPAGTVGSGQSPRVFLQTNRLGHCSSCGGDNGCYSDCKTLSETCGEYKPYTTCTYQVETGDDLAALAAQGGVSVEAVNAMNGGTPDTYWIPGNSVTLPYGMGLVLERCQPNTAPPPVVQSIAPVQTIAPIPGGPERVIVTPGPAATVYGTPVMTAAGPLAGQPNGNGKSQPIIARRPTVSFWNYGASEDNND